MNMVESWPEHLTRSLNELLGSCVTAGERWEVDQRSSPWRQNQISEATARPPNTEEGHRSCAGARLPCRGKAKAQTSSARLPQPFLHLRCGNERWKRLITLSGQQGGGHKGDLAGFPQWDIF